MMFPSNFGLVNDVLELGLRLEGGSGTVSTGMGLTRDGNVLQSV